MPRVAILVDTSTTWGRRVITGIHNYTRLHHAWQIFVEARGLEEPFSAPAEWAVEGVIARVSNPKMVSELHSLGVPVINVSSIELPGSTFPRVTTNVREAAALAVKHFQERGFQNFAYFSLLGLSYVSSQQDAFTQAVRQAGHDCTLFGVRTHAGAEPDWSFDLNKLATWLKRLPKPIAIFTWNASCAREILFGCQVAGVIVPEEVAVLSGADDDLLCEVSHIPISAIKVAAEQIGFQAAAFLDHWVTNHSVPKKNILLSPLEVVTRQSTDTLAIKDPALVKALNFIRRKADQPIQVEEVAANVGISRRALERRFSKTLNRTPAEEIRRHHLELAKKLLGETDMRIPDIADAAGFGSPEYMAFVFRRELGLNPRRYRKDITSC